MRVRVLVALPPLFIVALAASGQEREVGLEDPGALRGSFEAAGVRLSGFFVGSANYNSRIQMVPEFAGSAPVSSEPTRIDFRFDQFSIGAFKTALSFGRFDTPFGYERHDAALNLTATTSELQRFGRPQSMTGLQAAYQFAPWLDAAGWVVNRWENETTEDPIEDNNRAKSVGGRVGVTPIHGSRLLNFGIGGFWGPEQDDDNSHARWIVDGDVTWSPASQLLFAGEFAYGGESNVSFRRRGIPFAADAVDGADVHWFGFYGLIHYDLMRWLGLSFRYSLFNDLDGARTGVAQVLQSFTIVPIVHLSRLIPELRPLGVTYARTRHPIDWVDLRLEYRLGRSDQTVFSDVAPGIPITAAANTAHVVTAQLVVNY